MEIYISIYITILIASFYILVGIVDRSTLPAICEAYFSLETGTKIKGNGWIYSLWLTITAISYSTIYIYYNKDLVSTIIMLLICNGLSLMAANPKLSHPRHRFLHDVGLGVACVLISILVLYEGHQYLVIPAIIINLILCVIAKRYVTNSIGILLGYLSVLAYLLDWPSLYNILNLRGN